MNDAPRRTLRELIARHGPGLCSDARRCEGLLRDLCGTHRREINILLVALRERVPLDLLAARNSVPLDLLLTRLARRLEEHQALTEEAARWAVDSWALALGIISDAELDERARRRRSEATAPRVEAATRTAAPKPPVENNAPGSAPHTRPNTTPPHAPPRRAPPPASGRTSPPPSTTQTPPASGPAGARPSAPRAQRPTAQGGTNVATRPTATAPARRAPSSPQASGTGPLQAPSPDARAGGRRRRWRGCLVGCFLLVLLSVLLLAGGPFVLNILREEQQQRGLESPPPVQAP
jgi:hypothetical protein